MKWLGLDLECNLRGVWNIGIALFEGRKTLAKFNIFVEEFFSENPADFAFNGNVDAGAKYRKNREYLNQRHTPVWVNTASEADELVSTILQSWKFSRSFGYNSNVFDLGKLTDFPKTLKLVLDKPHVDLMPLVVEHLIVRKSYKAYWEKQVALGNTNEGNPEYAKFNAELVLNYIADLRLKKSGKTWVWKKEKHVGVEDLVEFEYPILHYFVRVLRKGMNADTPTPARKW